MIVQFAIDLAPKCVCEKSLPVAIRQMRSNGTPNRIYSRAASLQYSQTNISFRLAIGWHTFVV